MTFLRRANRIDLGLISDDDVAIALAEPLKNTEISWDDDALAEAVSICGGYPFMIQLIGQQAFRKKEGGRFLSLLFGQVVKLRAGN